MEGCVSSVSLSTAHHARYRLPPPQSKLFLFLKISVQWKALQERLLFSLAFYLVNRKTATIITIIYCPFTLCLALSKLLFEELIL